MEAKHNGGFFIHGEEEEVVDLDGVFSSSKLRRCRWQFDVEAALVVLLMEAVGSKSQLGKRRTRWLGDYDD